MTNGFVNHGKITSPTQQRRPSMMTYVGTNLLYIIHPHNRPSADMLKGLFHIITTNMSLKQFQLSNVHVNHGENEQILTARASN